MNKTRHCQSV